MSRMTPNMFVSLKDDTLIKKYGSGPCRILSVSTVRDGDRLVPAKIVLTDMKTGDRFDVLPNQVAPF